MITDADHKFLDDMIDEIHRAREKFPSSRYAMTALTEEVGELARALLHRAVGKATHEQIYSEAVQAATMALRVAVEGDPSIEIPAECSEPERPA